MGRGSARAGGGAAGQGEMQVRALDSGVGGARTWGSVGVGRGFGRGEGTRAWGRPLTPCVFPTLSGGWLTPLCPVWDLQEQVGTLRWAGAPERGRVRPAGMGVTGRRWSSQAWHCPPNFLFWILPHLPAAAPAETVPAVRAVGAGLQTP